MDQAFSFDEAAANPDPSPSEDDTTAAQAMRDPGVAEDVWQELEIAKMLELMERERMREEEEEARR